MNLIESCFSQSEVLDMPESFSLSLRCKTFLETLLSKLEFDLLGSFCFTLHLPHKAPSLFLRKLQISNAERLNGNGHAILAFLQELFSGGAKSIVMQISFTLQIFLLFWDEILGEGCKSLWGGQTASGVVPPPLEESQPLENDLEFSMHTL